MAVTKLVLSISVGHHLCSRPQLLGDKLNVNVGSGNFDRITIKIYKDNVARLEGLKASEFDFMQFYSAGDWARRATGKRFDKGDLTKRCF